MNDHSSLDPSSFSPHLPPAPPTLRDRHAHIVALMLVFGLIPAITVGGIFIFAIKDQLYYGLFLIALIPGAFTLWHLALAYGTWHNWRWAIRVARVWVRLSFPLTIFAAIALARTASPVGIGEGIILALVVAVAAAIAIAARS